MYTSFVRLHRPYRACNYKNRSTSAHVQGEIELTLRDLSVEDGGLNDNTSHTIRVWESPSVRAMLRKDGKQRAKLTDVRGGTPVLQVAITLSSDVTGNTNGSPTVSNARAEGSDVPSLVATGETHVVVVSVDSDVFIVLLGKLFDSSLDSLHTTLFTHGSGTEVCVASSTVPITGQRLGMEGDLDTPLLGKTGEEVAGHPEVVAHLDTLARANLELPLGRHDLGIDTADLDTSV